MSKNVILISFAIWLLASIQVDEIPAGSKAGGQGAHLQSTGAISLPFLQQFYSLINDNEIPRACNGPYLLYKSAFK